jgi:hypothetical protein
VQVGELSRSASVSKVTRAVYWEGSVFPLSSYDSLYDLVLQLG